VAGAICDKLVRRHPHVFGTSSSSSSSGTSNSGVGTGAPTPAEQSIVWEDIKARERGAAAEGSRLSHLDGVPRTLPALMRAFKLSKRAARVGFDFEHAGQTADKVAEELAEVREAAEQGAGADGSPSAGASPHIFEEIGDLLFAAANLARKLDVDAEAALRSANAKFERRFRGMESLAAQRGEIFAELNLDAQEKLWQEVKRGE
jgi:ATP diphosphatase